MTQLKLQDFFKELENSTMTYSDVNEGPKKYEDDYLRTETNVSFNSFKVQKSTVEKGEQIYNAFNGQESRGLYSHLSGVSADKSNTFTEGIQSRPVKSTGKDTITRQTNFNLEEDISFDGFTGFDKVLANHFKDNFWGSSDDN